MYSNIRHSMTVKICCVSSFASVCCSPSFTRLTLPPASSRHLARLTLRWGVYCHFKTPHQIYTYKLAKKELTKILFLPFGLDLFYYTTVRLLFFFFRFSFLSLCSAHSSFSIIVSWLWFSFVFAFFSIRYYIMFIVITTYYYY